MPAGAMRFPKFKCAQKLMTFIIAASQHRAPHVFLRSYGFQMLRVYTITHETFVVNL